MSKSAYEALKSLSQDITIYLRTGFGFVSAVRLNAELIELVEAKWIGTWCFAGNTLPNINQESTYEKCVNSEYDVGESILKITFYNGDSYDGSPERPRCYWRFKIEPDKGFYKQYLESYVEKELLQCAAEIVEREETERKLKRINEIYNKLFE